MSTPFCTVLAHNSLVVISQDWTGAFHEPIWGQRNTDLDALIAQVIEWVNETDADDEDDRPFFDEEDFDDFADPGGVSALRASSPGNPRNLPCPTCGMEDALTPADAARGYQCDRCADRAERGCDY